MKGSWIASILSTLLILSGGAYAMIYIHEKVPAKLKNNSLIAVASEDKISKKPNDMTLKEVIHNVQKFVVNVEMEDGSLGSGFLYNSKGDVITNAHVVSNNKDVTIKTTDSREFDGTVIGVSTDVDVAVVRVPGLAGEDFLKLRKNKKAEVGDEVIALGSPLGLQDTVTTGIISGVNRDFDLKPYHYEDMYQISAPITHGNSGGPLVSRKTGEVLGINSAGMDQGTIGFSIPVTEVIPIVEGWSANPMTQMPVVEMNSNSEEDEETISNTDAASYLVQYFYESVQYGDYVTAYSLLGSNWQTHTTYEDFRNGYLNTKNVEVDDLQATSSGDNVVVIGTISSEENVNGTTQYSKYQVKYTVGKENDQQKILSGNAKKIE
ncbi:S1C family serine protease [Falsibacillus albus]|uniref:Serine protease n=1 Tax=Falsibacillus albus TaxID=2478915 RepID=A0A3L7K2H9_9BACI|nr:trypsin-like peptidase domain-containing protein [Falsibacillus albus]RLQ94902.1 serine protease [Falsibacillus albus]